MAYLQTVFIEAVIIFLLPFIALSLI